MNSSNKNVSKQRRRSPLFLMALTILIDFTGFGLILPSLPFWAQHLGANAFGVGLIITIYALAQFLFTPLLGSLSDRYGRKPIITISLLIEAVSLVLTALAGSLPLLLAARFIGGIGASNIGSAQAVVADITTPQERAKGMGLIGAAIGLGFVIGPALAGVLSPFGQTIPFWIAGGVALLNALLVLCFFPETRKRQAAINKPVHHGWAVLFSGWHNACKQRAVVRLVGINFLFTLAFTAMEAIFALFSQHTFGWGTVQNGYVFTYIGVLVVIMQGGLVGRLVKRWHEQRVMIGGLVLLGVGLILLAFSTHVAWLLIALALLSIGDGAVTPTVSTLLSFSSVADAQGETLGFAQGIAGLARVIGPLVAGVLYDRIGAGIPFIAGGILGILALLLALSPLPLPEAQTSVSTAEGAETPVAVSEHSQMRLSIKK
jgi:multidrug resistance protein